MSMTAKEAMEFYKKSLQKQFDEIHLKAHIASYEGQHALNVLLENKFNDVLANDTDFNKAMQSFDTLVDSYKSYEYIIQELEKQKRDMENKIHELEHKLIEKM